MKIPRQISSTRMDMWREPIYLRVMFTGSDNGEVVDLAHRLREPFPESDVSLMSMIQMCRELVYDHQDGEPVFHAIAHSINAKRLDIEISNLFNIPITGSSPEEVSLNIRNILAYAFVCYVPVYPNTDELATELTEYTRELFLKGFTAPDETGKPMRLLLTDTPREEIETLEYFRNRSLTRQFTPAEIGLVRETALREISRRDEAGRVLAQVELAVLELSDALASTKANERALQRCLERNPILFGTEYRKVIPQHQLGAEYVMDFALEKTNGLVDLIEIEASTRPIFNKNGDPSRYLVHAEQQALDWLEWVERNGPYAREELPGLAGPVAFVVIGRRAQLPEQSSRRLRRRNLVFRERIRISTYDDILEGAKNLLQLLRGNGLAHNTAPTADEERR